MTFRQLELPQAAISRAVLQTHLRQGFVEAIKLHLLHRVRRRRQRKWRLYRKVLTKGHLAMTLPREELGSIRPAVESQSIDGPVALEPGRCTWRDQLQRLIEFHRTQPQGLLGLIQQRQCRQNESRCRKHRLSANPVVA